MPEWVTVDIDFETLSIPAPPIDIDTEPIHLPDIGPFSLPSFSFGPIDFPPDTVRIPEFRVPFIDVLPGTQTVTLPDLGPFPIPKLPSIDLDIKTNSVTIPLIDFDIKVIAPFRSGLDFGNIGFRDFTLKSPGSIQFPTISVVTDQITVGGDKLGLPSFDIPRVDTGGLSIPEVDLSEIPRPTGASLEGSIDVPDPTTLGASVSVDFDAIKDFVLAALPTDFVADAAEWVFFTVLDQATKHITKPVANTLKAIIEGFLQLLLSPETKETVAEAGARARERQGQD
jgi:hypothetical protein